MNPKDIQKILPESHALGATLFQAYQLVAKGVATREGKLVCFSANDQSHPSPSLLTPIMLKVCGSDDALELRTPQDWDAHLKCLHWTFEIA